MTGPTYFGIASQIGYIAPNGAGADFTLSAVIGLLFMVPLGVMYYIFETQMPRSGGDYVWMGRSLHPSIGFVAGWAMWLSFLALKAGGAATWGAVVVPAVLGNAYLATLVQLGFLIFFPWWGCGLVLSASMYVFAFSFDRILPCTFGDFNARLHIPIKATILTLVVGSILLAFTAYTSYIGQFLNTTTIWSIVWIIVGIPAILFPIRRKELPKGLPGGSMALQIAGAASVVVMAITFYFAVTTPAIGPSTPAADGLLAAIFGSGIIIYALRYYYFKGRGINMGAELQEITPE